MYQSIHSRSRSIWLLVGVASVIGAASATAATTPVARPTVSDTDLCAQDSGDAAIAACTRAIVSGPHSDDALAELYYNRGFEQRKKGNYEAAIADYSEAIRLNPTDPDAFNNRGIVWHKIGENEKALADYNEAIRLNPTDPEVFYNRGLVWREIGENEKAVADYSEAIRLNPTDPDAFYNRGLVWREIGENEKAVADYDEAIRLRRIPTLSTIAVSP